MGAIGSFLGIRSVRLPVVFSVTARVPASAIGIALPLLALSERMSPAIVAGTLVACRGAQAVSGPLWGRFVDSYSLRLALLTVGVAFGLTVSALAVLPRSERALIACSVVAGVLTLPIPALMRAL